MLIMTTVQRDVTYHGRIYPYVCLIFGFLRALTKNVHYFPSFMPPSPPTSLDVSDGRCICIKAYDFLNLQLELRHCKCIWMFVLWNSDRQMLYKELYCTCMQRVHESADSIIFTFQHNVSIAWKLYQCWITGYSGSLEIVVKRKKSKWWSLRMQYIYLLKI